jgi:hypothetical protein
MFRRSLAVSLLLLLVAFSTSRLRAQQMTTDADRSWRELRNSQDVKRKLLADRWRNVTRQQDWGDATGKFKTSAKYVEHDPQLAWVKLRVIQGTGSKRVVKDVQIPLEKLSKTCQSRVRQIATLSEKIAAAIEEEKKAAEDDEAGAEGGGREMMDESRGARGEMEDGRGEMDVVEPAAETRGEVLPEYGRSETVSESPVTNNGPPLPAALPPLPTGVSAPSAELASGESPTHRELAPSTEDTAEPRHPTTAEELRDAFQAAFVQGDREALERLVYWGELSAELRQETYAQLLNFAGSSQLHRCEIAIQTGGESVQQYTLQSPTHLRLEIETRADYLDMDWPMGEADGRFYLGALNRTAAQQEQR